MEMMTNPSIEGEKDLRICKVCRELKVRIANGRYPNRKDRRFVDESGLSWNGRVCGTCHAGKMKEKMRVKREPKQEG